MVFTLELEEGVVCQEAPKLVSYQPRRREIMMMDLHGVSGSVSLSFGRSLHRARAVHVIGTHRSRQDQTRFCFPFFRLL